MRSLGPPPAAAAPGMLSGAQALQPHFSSRPSAAESASRHPTRTASASIPISSASAASSALPFGYTRLRLRLLVPTVTAASYGTRAGKSGFGASSGDEARIDKDALVYWKKIIAEVDRPGLGGLVGSLDWEHPLGLTRKRASGHVQCYQDFLAAKKKHPTKVVLVRIGDFYEAVGFDALVLCQYCNLNPMTPYSMVAEAGFPRAHSNLQRQLNRLIAANFSVAVVEEIRSVPGIGRTPARKERKLVQVVSASSPYYLHGDVDDEYEGDDTPLPRPIMGISLPSAGGYRLMRYCPERRAVLVASQLSREALVAHLHATGLAQPLHVHTSVREGETGRGSTLARALAALLGTTAEEYGPGAGAGAGPGGAGRAAPAVAFRRGGGGGSALSDVEGFKQVVAQQLGLERREAEAMEVLTPGSVGDTPIPPSLSTVTQLGLAGARGVPSLLTAALSDSTPAPAREWMRRLLLLPPPPTVADDIRMVCRQLVGPDPTSGPLPLPPLVTSLPSARVVAVLGDAAAGHNTLREMQSMLTGVADLLRLPGQRAQLLHAALGGLLQWCLTARAGISWAQVPARLLAEQCMATADVIGAVVPESGALGAEAAGLEEEAEGNPIGEDDDDDDDTEMYGTAAVAAPASGGGAGRQQACASVPAVLLPYLQDPGMTPLRRRAVEEAGRLMRRLERFRLWVREERMKAVCQRVGEARTAVVEALLELASALEGAGTTAAELKLAPHDDAVWVRLMSGSGSSAKRMSTLQQQQVVEAVRQRSGGRLQLEHPYNRKRSREADRYTTARLEKAAAAYREAAEAAEKEARRLLRELCSQLYGSSTSAAAGSHNFHLYDPHPDQPQSLHQHQHHLVTLLAANELSVAFTALERHVDRAMKARWNWPDMPPLPTLDRPDAEAGRVVRLALPGLWPYWMDARDAVHNDIRLEAGRVALLTGPNMAGKSTVLRSIAAATLLATCGLAVPAGQPRPLAHLSSPSPPPLPSSSPSTASGSGAASAVPPQSQSQSLPLDFFVSWVSHVSLRNFSGDSPLEGKSAFAVEMEDTSHTVSVARSVGPRCLVLLDELGKGTEVVTGSALAAAVVDDLAASGAAGVFATHLHDVVFLLEPLQREGRMEYWAMEVQREPEAQLAAAARGAAAAAASAPAPELLRPTRRIRVGAICLRSLALQVAVECGMQGEVVQRARRYEAVLGAMMRAARAKQYGRQIGGAVGEGDGSGVVGGSELTHALWEEAAEWLESADSELETAPGLVGAAAEAVAEAEMKAEMEDGQASLERPADASVGRSGHETEAGAAIVKNDSDWKDNGNGSGGSSGSGSDVDGDLTSEGELLTATAAGEPLQDLSRAAEALRDMVRAAMVRAGCEVGPEAGNLNWLRAEWKPSPGHVGEAAVYILQRWDGLLYVGETEDIAGRVKTHRSSETRERKAAGKPLTAGKRNQTSLVCVYSVVPRQAGGRSAALDVEADVIAALQRSGCELRSAHDKKRDGLHRPRTAAAAASPREAQQPQSQPQTASSA